MFNEKNEVAYRKIWGLKQLEKMGFPIPPYVVVNLHNKPVPEMEKYIRKKIKCIGIPKLEGDRVGVTIRVSVPYGLDKVTKHGGLHRIDESDVIKRVLAKYDQYKPQCKIIVQHTVDAKASGTILKEGNHAIVEVVVGDAPELLEGRTTSYERWIFDLNSGRWNKDRSYVFNNKIHTILNSEELRNLEKYIRALPGGVYLEWSLSKNGKLYFYEYTRLSGI